MGAWWSRQWAVVRAKGLVHWTIFFCLLLIGYFIGQLLEHGSAMTGARYWLYQHQMAMQSAGPVYPRRSAVVLLDDADYWSEGYAGRSPVNRERLAELLTTLDAAEVQTIAVDVDLRSPDRNCPGCDFAAYRQEDEALLAAMRRLCAHGRWLVLGTSVRFADGLYSEVPSLYSWALTHDPRHEYTCVTPGYLQLPHDMRQLPGPIEVGDGRTLDSLALAAEHRLDPSRYAQVLAPADRGFRFGRYLSESDFGAETGPFRFSGHALLAAWHTQPRRLQQQLAGRVVLVGGAWHSVAIGQGARTDLYDSPMGAMPGVLLHANYLEAFDGERGSFAPMPDWVARVFEYGLAVGLALVGTFADRGKWKALALTGSIVLSLLLTYVLLQNLGIFMDFLIPLCMLIGHTLVEEALAWRHQLHHLRRHVKELQHAAKQD